eukprot:scaffold78794_cov40-Phaeocystis_antarctica.AAC.1
MAAAAAVAVHGGGASEPPSEARKSLASLAALESAIGARAADGPDMAAALAGRVDDYTTQRFREPA